VEAYTVVHDRSGQPERGVFVGRLEDGRRFIANLSTQDGLEALRGMTEREMVGQRGRVSHDSKTGLNTIVF
jgi:acetyl-CoA C-acetyltransferase